METAHRRLSACDWRFREIARERPELLRRQSFASLDAANPILFYPLQSWPTFVEGRKLGEMATAAAGVVRLIRRLPEIAFDNDPEALDAFYGIGNPTLTQLLFEPPNGIAGSVGRGDFIQDERGFHCIEINVAANLGGWETELLASMYLANPVLAGVIEELGVSVSWISTTGVLFAHLLEEAEGLVPPPEGEIGVALVMPADRAGSVPGELSGHLTEELRRFAASHGAPTGRVVVCTYPELTFDGLMLSHGGRRIHAVVELFLSQTPPDVYRSFKAGAVGLYNGPLGRLLSDKRNLALLSNPTRSANLSPQDRALVDAHVPWTRIVAPGTVVFEGEEADLVELVRERRGELVLKRGQSGGGEAAYLGRATSGDEWNARLEEALAEGTWVIQRHVESLPYLFQAGPVGCCPHQVVWGPFVFGERFGGMVLRMQPASEPGAVNLRRSATQGIVLGVEERGS